MVQGGSEEVKRPGTSQSISATPHFTVKGKTQEQLIDDLYTEMAEFFLS